jgi:dihydroflavonol-4-reductase
MRVLVTGATGLLGNAIANKLVAAGHEVTALVRDVGRARGVLPPAVRLVEGDVTQPPSLRPAVRGVEVVFHAAGVQHARIRDESIFDRVNHRGTEHVLGAALDAGVERVVYTSAIDVFRKDAGGVLREDERDPELKRSAYARSMQAAAQVAARFHRQGMELVYIHPGAMYGPCPFPAGLNAYLMDVLRGRIPVLMPGGVAVAHIDGVADAHIAAANRARPGECYLVADSYVTMAEFVAIAVRTAGVGKVPRTAPPWLLKPIDSLSASLARVFGLTPPLPQGVLTLLLWRARIDTSKAQRELDFAPTPVEEGISGSVGHFQEQGMLPE